MDGQALSEAVFYTKVNQRWEWSNTRIAKEITGQREGPLFGGWLDRVITALQLAHLNGEAAPLTTSSIDQAEQLWKPRTPEVRQLEWEKIRDRAPVTS